MGRFRRSRKNLIWFQYTRTLPCNRSIAELPDNVIERLVSGIKNNLINPLLVTGIKNNLLFSTNFSPMVHLFIP